MTRVLWWGFVAAFAFGLFTFAALGLAVLLLEV